MTKLIFIRHGQSTYNLEHRYTGQLDIPLTEKGVRQAEITAEYVLKNYKIDAIYSSDLSRSVNTAKPIADALGLPIKTDARLREIHAGDWQDRLFSEIKETCKEEYDKYVSSGGCVRTPNGESLEDVLNRTYAAVLDIIRENEGKTVLISSHNGPIKTLAVPFLGQKLPDTKSVSNNSVTEVDCDGGKYTVVKLGYDEHLSGMITAFTEKTAN